MVKVTVHTKGGAEITIEALDATGVKRQIKEVLAALNDRLITEPTK
jgi:hypothetical protein